MKIRVGDTLIEVVLAIGIFSMVAIAVVAVMNGGTSSAQVSLETTLAREEIDTQAEALRFIHSAYVAGVSSNSADPYVDLWNEIIGNAIDPNTDSEYLNYTPQTCQAVENSSTLKNKGFVINPRKLGSAPSESYVKYNNNIFKAASTYPRLIYTSNEAAGTDSLINSSDDVNLYRVEGIYVIAVKDDNSTQIVDDKNPQKGVGFYDFYIRTCWYGAGASNPSTISTVIRLYNPQDEKDRYTTPTVRINFRPNGGGGTMDTKIVKAGETYIIPNSTFTSPTPSDTKIKFRGWNTSSDATGYGYQLDGSIKKTSTDVTYQPGSEYKVPGNIQSFQVLNLYAIWDQYKIAYNTNGGTLIPTTFCSNKNNCSVSSAIPTRLGYRFDGWKSDTNVTYQPGNKITPTDLSTTLYAVWTSTSKIINYNANGGTGGPVSSVCMLIDGSSITYKCTIDSTSPTRQGYQFLGWSNSNNASAASYSPNGVIQGQAPFIPDTLYAVWKSNAPVRDSTVTISMKRGDWFNDDNYYSILKYTLENGITGSWDTRRSYYKSRASYYYGTTLIASATRDNYYSSEIESVTINTSVVKDFSYIVYDYFGYNVEDVNIIVSGNLLGTKTFNRSFGYYSCKYWYVFSYNNGKVQENNNCSRQLNL